MKKMSFHIILERTSDVEYYFPFGWKELEGIAYRGNFDLSRHMEYSGKDLSVFDEETKTSYIPHVVECSVGTDRLFLTILFDAYQKMKLKDETRVVFKFIPISHRIRQHLCLSQSSKLNLWKKFLKSLKRKGYSVQYDLSGSIGKRYRRQDEIGTPFCFTYDFDSPQDGTVTVRHRDTMKQERIAIDSIEAFIQETLSP